MLAVAVSLAQVPSSHKTSKGLPRSRLLAQAQLNVGSALPLFGLVSRTRLDMTAESLTAGHRG